MNTVTGLGSAVRLTWRRNRLFWILWIIVLAALMPALASQYDTVFPPGADPRAVIEPLRANPTLSAILGPPFDLYSKGGFVFWRAGGFTTVLAALMAGLGIIRATRAEEEAGRVELLRSGPIGRHAPLTAAVLLASAASLAAGVVITAALLGLGLPAPGSVAAGLAVAVTGMVFVGIGAVLAQVFDNARSANAWTLGVGLGGMYLLRALIDGNGLESNVTWARWLIPLEWGMLSRPYAEERWWVFTLPVACTLGLVALAYNLESRRDHGAGLRHSRSGRAQAAAYLSGSWGLAWRLQRSGLIGWTLGLVVSAVAFGSIGAQMDQVFQANPQLAYLLERLGGTAQLQTGFFVAMLGLMAIMVTWMAVSVLGRLRAEENRGHSEVMLATATTRWSYVLSHLSLALVVPAVVLVAVGAGLPLALAAQDSAWGLVGDFARGGAGLLPGLVLVIGIGMLLIGWLPRLAGLVWVVVGWSLFAAWFAALFDLPEWLVKLQPWGYLAALPRDPMNWTAFAVELALGLVLVMIGLVGYRRRDIVGL